MEHEVELMQLLLERRGSEIKITEGVLQGVLLNWRSGDAILKPLLKRRRAKNRSPTKHSRALYLSGEMNPDLRLILIRGAEIKTIDRAWQVAVSGWPDQKEMVQPLCDRQAMDLNASTFRFPE